MRVRTTAGRRRHTTTVSRGGDVKSGLRLRFDCMPLRDQVEAKRCCRHDGLYIGPAVSLVGVKTVEGSSSTRLNVEEMGWEIT